MIPSIVPAAASPNPLLPNFTIVAELVGFIILLFVVARYILPVINKALTNRQEAIRTEFEELEQGKANAKKAEERYRSALSEAHHEANQIRQKATDDGARIVAEAREKAQAESARILANAQNQLAAERTHVVHELRSHVGGMATALAGRIVGESLDDEARRRRTVERFLEDLERSEPSSAGSDG